MAGGVPAERLEDFEAPQLAGLDALPGAHAARVIAAPEAQLHRLAGRRDDLHHALGLGEVQGDGLLAPDRLAGEDGRLDERSMGARGRDDHDGVHVRTGRGLERIGRCALGTRDGRAAGHGVGVGSATTTTRTERRPASVRMCACPMRPAPRAATRIGSPRVTCAVDGLSTMNSPGPAPVAGTLSSMGRPARAAGLVAAGRAGPGRPLPLPTTR